MFRYEITTETPTPYAAVMYGPHLKVFKNPALTAYMPCWLQEFLLNKALDGVTPAPPKRLRQEAAEGLAPVIALDALRVARQQRAACDKPVGM